MTKSGNKDAPKATKPKLKKETVKDLDPKRQGEDVRGGMRGGGGGDGACTYYHTGCTDATE